MHVPAGIEQMRRCREKDDGHTGERQMILVPEALRVSQDALTMRPVMLCVFVCPHGACSIAQPTHGRCGRIR